jgi:hypothetical protein
VLAYKRGADEGPCSNNEWLLPIYSEKLLDRIHVENPTRCHSVTKYYFIFM